MKVFKPVLATLLFASFTAPAFADYGLEAVGIAWTADDSDMETSFNNDVSQSRAGSFSYNGSVTRQTFAAGANIFIEGNSKSRMGVAFGYETIPNSGYSYQKMAVGNSSSLSLDQRSGMVPVTFYWKYVQSKKVSFTLGAGASYLRSKHDYSYTQTVGATTTTYSKTFVDNAVPLHLTGGVEFWLTDFFSLGLSAKYLIGGVMDSYNDGDTRLWLGSDNSITTCNGGSCSGRPYQVNFSGLRGQIFLRMYFDGLDDDAGI